MHTKRIIKFGGSSLSNADCFRRVKKIIEDRMDLNPLVVVSAMGVDEENIKLTDRLEEIGIKLYNGEPADETVWKILNRHFKLIKDLELPEDTISEEIREFKSEMETISREGYPNIDEALDAIMGFGEIFCAKIMAEFLSGDGKKFIAANPAEFNFVTDENFRNADVLDESLQNIAAKVISSRNFIVFPGFIGVTAIGQRTTLGRGGSDYTAAIFGAALKRGVEIWSDVDGIYRINPDYLPHQFKEVGHPRTIPELSYDEAFQMASFGSRVLHKKTLAAVQHAVRKGKHIHIRIKNTFNPDHPGTEISSRKNHSGIPKGITCLEGTQLLNLYPRSYRENSEIAGKLEEITGLNAVLASQTWGRVSFVFDCYHPELSKIESEYVGHLSRDQVLVKIVGDGIGENPAILSRIQSAVHSAERPEKYGMTLVHKSPQLMTDNTYEFVVKKRGILDILLALYKDLFMQDIVAVGCLGMGTVGSGVIRYEKEMYSTEKSGFKLIFPSALVRNPHKLRKVEFEGKYTTNVDEVLENPLVDIVLELIGGIEPARTYILKAMEKGKHIVTANKALLALYGGEIFEAAHKYRKNIGFEASVCAEIPIIDDFLKFPGLTDIEGIEGIVNGTSNYVLSRFMEGMSLDEAIELAQEKGFAESDPTMDISGSDAAQKLAILTSILFNQPIDFREIPCQGIDGLKLVDGRAFKSWNVTVKPLVMARMKGDEIELRVAPALVKDNHPLSSVREENNALSLYLTGRDEPITKIGKGAGAIPTARSIVRDILDVSRKSRAYMVDVPGFFKSKSKRKISPGGDFESRWYARFTVDDSPGVLGKITTILGDFNLSIFRVYQEKEKVSDCAHILFELKKSNKSQLDKAVDIITRFPFLRGCFICMMV